MSTLLLPGGDDLILTHTRGKAQDIYTYQRRRCFLELNLVWELLIVSIPSYL